MKFKPGDLLVSQNENNQFFVEGILEKSGLYAVMGGSWHDPNHFFMDKDFIENNYILATDIFRELYEI